ncbi:hypothetical protein [Yinghuangia sp. YIM S09857]|uniref:hypothetical protein n=1 Tax=Yinghuangia sp. YIM S09857 TaxID=3436929 RepID=UPI003F538E9E
MSSGGPGMRAAQGLRGTVALLTFLALIVGAALFGGCDIVGKAARTDDAADDTPAASTSSASNAAPATVPPAQPIPRGTATPTLPLPSTAQVAQSDATAVSSAALTVMFTYDTTTDTTAQDAVLRAQPWLTEAYAAVQREHVSVGPPGAQWTEWTGHQAYTTPALERGRDQAPPDTATTAYRQWLVRYTPTGRDGWKGNETAVVVFTVLTRPSATEPWRVSDMLVRS